MAFELRLAQADGSTFVEPVSPALMRPYRVSRATQLVILTLLWALAVALLVGVTMAYALGTRWFGWDLPGGLLPLLAYLVGPLIAITWHQISGEPARVVYGFAQDVGGTGSHTSWSPDLSRPASRVASAIGALLGCGIAPLGIIWGAEPTAGIVGYATAVLVIAVIPVLSVMSLVRDLPRIAEGRAWRRLAQRRREEVIALGHRHVARVTSVRPITTWVDALPVIRCTIEWTDDAGHHEAAIRFTDYPCWVPVEGTEFDVWVDPAAPDDPRRTFLERRLVNQPFVEDPVAVRAAGSGDSGPGPVHPPWMDDDGLTTGKRHVRGFLAVLAALCAAVGIAAFVVTAIGVPDLAPWQLGLSALHAFLLTVGAALFLALFRRQRWMANWGMLTAGLLALPFASLFAIALCVLSSDAMWDMDATNAAGHRAVQLTVASLVAAVVMYGLFFVFIFNLDRLFNAGIRIPGAEVAEVVRSNDPRRIRDLHARTGYWVGKLHGP